MDHRAQMLEVDRNYDFFQRNVGTFLQDHTNEYALLRAAAVVGFFKSLRAAGDEADRLFVDGIYSIQEVTVEPIDLGIFSHAGH